MVEFIWKAELKHYANQETEHLRAFFVHELCSLLENSTQLTKNEVRTIVDNEYSSSFKFPFIANKYNQPSEDELNQVGSTWFYWSSLKISQLRNELNRKQPDTGNQKFAIEFCDNLPFSIIINDLFTRFTRYEGKRFIVLHLSVDVDHSELTTPDSVIKLQKRVSRFLSELFPQIENDKYRVTDKFEEYKELLQIMNPAPILPMSRLADFKKLVPEDSYWVSGGDHTRLTQKVYLEKEKLRAKNADVKSNSSEIDVYVREQQTIYFAETSTVFAEPDVVAPEVDDGQIVKINMDRNRFVDRYHTEMLFFIRGQHYEKQLQPLFSEVTFLHNVSQFINDHWGQIRALYAVTPKYAAFGNNASARIMFFLLELNAHFLGLQTRVNHNFNTLDRKLDEQLERPMFNLEPDATQSEREYYEKLKLAAKKSFTVYSQKRQQAAGFADLIDQNIQKLHGDFDSKSNMVLQSLIFIFSIIFVIWGAYEVYLDKTFNEMDNLTGFFPLMGYSVVGLAVLLFTYLIISKFFLTITSFSFSRPVKKRIRSWMEKCNWQEEIGLKGNSSSNERSNGCDGFARENNFKAIDEIVKKRLRQTDSYSKGMEVALQFVSVGIIGVSMGQLDPMRVQTLLSTVSETLRKKSVKSPSLVSSVWDSTKGLWRNLTRN